MRLQVLLGKKNVQEMYIEYKESLGGNRTDSSIGAELIELALRIKSVKKDNEVSQREILEQMLALLFKADVVQNHVYVNTFKNSIEKDEQGKEEEAKTMLKGITVDSKEYLTKFLNVTPAND